MSLLLIIGALTGCYKEPEFLLDKHTATCQWYDECGFLSSLGYDSVDECVDEATRADELDEEQGTAVCPSYDAENARICVEELQNRACEDYEEDISNACEAACGE